MSARPSRNQWSGGDVALGDREEAGQAGLGREQVVVARVQRRRPGPGTRSRTACGSGRTGSVKSISRNSCWAWSAIALEAAHERRRGRRGRVGRRAGRRASASSAIVGKAVRLRPELRAARGRGAWLLHGQPGRLGPGHELAVRSAPHAPPSGPRRRPTACAACAASSAELRRPGVGRRGDGGVGAGQRLERLVEMPPGERSGSAGRRRSRRRPRGSARSRRRSRPARRPTGSGWSIIWRQALDSVEQVAGEVAAVDRRHVRGLEPAAGRACRTSCRGGRGTARGCRWSRASPRGAPPSRASRSSRSRGRSRSPAGTSRCSSARCGGRRRAADRPGSCRAAGALSSAPTKVSKNRHVRRAVRRSDAIVGGRELLGGRFARAAG